MAASPKFEDTRSALNYIGLRTLKSSNNKEIVGPDLVYRGIRTLKSLTCGLCQENSIKSRDELADILTSKRISPNRDIAYKLVDGLLIHDSHNNTVHSSIYTDSSGRHKISFGFALLPSRSLPKEEKTGKEKQRIKIEYALCFSDLR